MPTWLARIVALVRFHPQCDSPDNATGATASARSVDLSDCHALTFDLLDDTRAWRERLVQEFVLGDRDHVRSSSSYQLRLPLDLVRSFHPGAESGDTVRL